jgi:hypothetical protein
MQVVILMWIDVTVMLGVVYLMLVVMVEIVKCFCRKGTSARNPCSRSFVERQVMFW